MVDDADKKTEYAGDDEDTRDDVIRAELVDRFSEAADEETKANKWACRCLASRAAAHPRGDDAGVARERGVEIGLHVPGTNNHEPENRATDFPENHDCAPSSLVAAMLRAGAHSSSVEAPVSWPLMNLLPPKARTVGGDHRSRPAFRGASCTGTERRPSGGQGMGRNK